MLNHAKVIFLFGFCFMINNFLWYFISCFFFLLFVPTVLKIKIHATRTFFFLIYSHVLPITHLQFT
jgi:hypothetical protein